MDNQFLIISKDIMKLKPETRTLFFNCLFLANWKDAVWNGIEISRGSFVTSYSKLSKITGLPVNKLRHRLNSLKTTGEITSKATNKYSLITVVRYDFWVHGGAYSTSETTSKTTSGITSKPQAKPQQLNKNNTKEDKRYKIKDKSTCVPELKIHYLTERLFDNGLIVENEAQMFDGIIREYLAEYDAVDVSVKADYVLGQMKGKQVDNRLAYFKSAMNKNHKYSYLPETEESEDAICDEEVDLEELNDFLMEFE